MEIARAYSRKNALVFGCYSGMGAATACALVDAGAQVRGFDIRGQGPSGVAVSSLDIRDPSAIEAAISAVPGGVDAVFIAAGLPTTADPLEVVTVNFLGVRHVVETVMGKMARGGAIATIASVAGNQWMSNMAAVGRLLDTRSIEEGRRLYAADSASLGAAYGLSKQALVAYTILNAPGYIQRGVRLNTLSPGMTETPMLPEFHKANPKGMAALRIPIGRPSSAEEQAVGLLMLNHPEATYLVGANLVNDGGMTLEPLRQRLSAAAT